MVSSPPESPRLARRLSLLLCLALVCPLGAGIATAGEPTRTYALGFTDFPHARTAQAIVAAFDVIRLEGDMAVMQFNDGVPWPEALIDVPYPTGFEDEINRKLIGLPTGHRVYLAVSPLNSERDGLVPVWGTVPGDPEREGWDDAAFDDPAVVDAYITHVLRLIDRFGPDWFAYGVEVNTLFEMAPEKWDAFVSLSQQVYTAVKTAHPQLPVFVSFQADFFKMDPDGQTSAIAPLLPVTDVMAVSSYPFFQLSDPSEVPADQLTAVADLAPGKPFAIAETGWPAEDVTSPFPRLVPATASDQQNWLQQVLGVAMSRDAMFVSWPFTRDYDDLWETDIQFLESASIARAWKDNGLLAGDGAMRPALQTWRADKAKVYVPEPGPGLATLTALVAVGLVGRSRLRRR